MAFPNDLSDVVVFKIHPAIGIARLSRNNDYFVFGRDPGNYKSNGLMKGQAVQFRVYAYGENHVGLGELTPKVMTALGISAVWSARVGNRKVARRMETPLSGTEFVISAQASSDDANGGKLTGKLDGYDEGGAIPLGQITAAGVFIPPVSRAFRKTAGEALPSFPGSDRVVDNSCDGEISVRLNSKGGKTGGKKSGKKGGKKGGQLPDVLSACIVVCGHDFSPDTSEDTSLIDFFKRELQISPTAPLGNLHNQAARTLDEAALRPATEDFFPGIEVSFGNNTEVPSVKSICHQSSQDPRIDPREARIRYKAALNDTAPGAVPGQLTSGLCSPWQSDYMACVGFWAEHLPPRAYLDENESTIVRLFRRRYDDQESGPSTDSGTLQTADDFDQYLDQIGVVRLRDGKKVETERGPGDDIPKPVS